MFWVYLRRWCVATKACLQLIQCTETLQVIVMPNKTYGMTELNTVCAFLYLFKHHLLGEVCPGWYELCTVSVQLQAHVFCSCPATALQLSQYLCWPQTLFPLLSSSNMSKSLGVHIVGVTFQEYVYMPTLCAKVYLCTLILSSLTHRSSSKTGPLVYSGTKPRIFLDKIRHHSQMYKLITDVTCETQHRLNINEATSIKLRKGQITSLLWLLHKTQTCGLNHFWWSYEATE